MKSCVECRHYHRCRDPNKGHSYSCSEYKKIATVKTGSIVEILLGESEDYPSPSVVSNVNPSLLTKSHELDLMTMVEEALSNPSPIPKDLKIDDGDLKEHPNFYEWCMDSRGANQPPFSRQLGIGLHLFGQWCPRCSHTRFANVNTIPYKASPEVVAENVSILKYGVCPKCKVTRSELFRTGELNEYVEFAGCLGQRSGKSALFSLLAPYITQHYLKLQNPNKVLGLMQHSTLSATFVGLTFARAVALLWNPVHTLISNSEWFKQYHKLLDYYADKYGEEGLYSFKDTFIQYRHRGLYLYPMGPNKRTLRGDCFVGSTIINTESGFSTLDELIHVEGFNKADLLVDTPKGIKRVSHTLKTQRETLVVATRNGYSVECTPEEPLLVVTPDMELEWRSVSQLKVGDFIVSCTSANSPMFGTESVNLNQATILGYMTANGYRSELSSGDKKVIARFRDAVREETGKYPTKIGKHIKGVCVPNWYMSKTYLHNILNPLGYSPTSAYDKCIPFSVRQAPKHILHEFLESYFECDCGINGGRTKGAYKGKTDGIEIELTTASKLLSQQLQVILLQVYGIVSRYRVESYIPHSQRIRGGTRVVTYHILSLTGYDADLFLQHFKRAKAQKYANRVVASEAGVGSDRRVVPYIRKYISDVYENARAEVYSGIGKGISKSLMIDGERVPNNIRPRLMNNRSQANHCTGTRAHCPEGLFYNDDWSTVLPRISSMDKVAAKRIKQLLKLRPHFEEITSIEVGRKTWVYDLTVPDAVCFTANGLAAHNTRFMSGIDELGWFFNGGVEDDEAREKASGREVHGALDRSMKTVRTKVRARVKTGAYILTGYLMSISSPSHARDMIMTLVNTHSDSSDVLAVHLPTWEFNPDYNGREDFSKEYKEDWARAERDFGAQPSINTNPYISEEDESLLRRTFIGVNRVRYDYKIWEKPNSRLKYKSLRIVNTVAAPQEHGSVLLLDAGYSNNSFSVSVATKNKVPTFTALLECAPVKGEELVNFNHIYEILKALCKEFNVQVVIADRWNSIKLLQDLEQEMGVEIIHYSLKFADFVNAKSYLLNEQPAVIFPKPEMEFDVVRQHTENYPHVFALKPVTHLYFQFLTVKQMGRVVDKGDGLTDDLFRTVILGITFLTDVDFCAKLATSVRGKGGIGTSTTRVGMVGTVASNFAVVGSRRGIT